MAGSRNCAKTFPLPDAERAWKESEAAYFSRSCDLQTRYDHASSSWKMCQLFESAGDQLSSENWPAEGMTVDGSLYRLPTWERTIRESDGGCWPTPRANKVGGYSREDFSPTLEQKVKMWPTPKGTGSGPDFARRSRDGSGGDDLATAVAKELWPTPRASEWKGCGPKGSKSQQYRLEKGYLDATVSEREQVGGQLNPTWVEWLMNYPPGWTEISEWAEEWFRGGRKNRRSQELRKA